MHCSRRVDARAYEDNFHASVDKLYEMGKSLMARADLPSAKIMFEQCRALLHANGFTEYKRLMHYIAQCDAHDALSMRGMGQDTAEMRNARQILQRHLSGLDRVTEKAYAYRLAQQGLDREASFSCFDYDELVGMLRRECEIRAGHARALAMQLARPASAAAVVASTKMPCSSPTKINVALICERLALLLRRIIDNAHPSRKTPAKSKTHNGGEGERDRGESASTDLTACTGAIDDEQDDE